MSIPNPSAVHVVGFNPTSYGVWGILITQLVVLTGFLIKRGPEYIASWMAMRQQGVDHARQAKEAEEAEEKASEKRLSDLEAKVDRLKDALSFLMNAAITSTNALEGVSPGNIAVGQSRELLGMAVSALGQDDPFARSLGKLATFKGFGE